MSILDDSTKPWITLKDSIYFTSNIVIILTLYNIYNTLATIANKLLQVWLGLESESHKLHSHLPAQRPHP